MVWRATGRLQPTDPRFPQVLGWLMSYQVACRLLEQEEAFHRGMVFVYKALPLQPKSSHVVSVLIGQSLRQRCRLEEL